MNKLIVILFAFMLICASGNVHVTSKNARPRLEDMNDTMIMRAVYKIHFRNGTIHDSNTWQRSAPINHRGLSLHSSKYVLCQKPEIPKPTTTTTTTTTKKPPSKSLNTLHTQLTWSDDEIDLEFCCNGEAEPITVYQNLTWSSMLPPGVFNWTWLSTATMPELVLWCAADTCDMTNDIVNVLVTNTSGDNSSVELPDAMAGVSVATPCCASGNSTFIFFIHDTFDQTDQYVEHSKILDESEIDNMNGSVSKRTSQEPVKTAITAVQTDYLEFQTLYNVGIMFLSDTLCPEETSPYWEPMSEKTNTKLDRPRIEHATDAKRKSETTLSQNFTRWDANQAKFAKLREQCETFPIVCILHLHNPRMFPPSLHSYIYGDGALMFSVYPFICEAQLSAVLSTQTELLRMGYTALITTQEHVNEVAFPEELILSIVSWIRASSDTKSSLYKQVLRDSLQCEWVQINTVYNNNNRNSNKNRKVARSFYISNMQYECLLPVDMIGHLPPLQFVVGSEFTIGNIDDVISTNKCEISIDLNLLVEPIKNDNVTSITVSQHNTTATTEHINRFESTFHNALDQGRKLWHNTKHWLSEHFHVFPLTQEDKPPENNGLLSSPSSSSSSSSSDLKANRAKPEVVEYGGKLVLRSTGSLEKALDIRNLKKYREPLVVIGAAFLRGNTLGFTRNLVNIPEERNSVEKQKSSHVNNHIKTHFDNINEKDDASANKFNGSKNNHKSIKYTNNEKPHSGPRRRRRQNHHFQTSKMSNVFAKTPLAESNRTRVFNEWNGLPMLVMIMNNLKDHEVRSYPNDSSDSSGGADQVIRTCAAKVDCRGDGEVYLSSINRCVNTRCRYMLLFTYNTKTLNCTANPIFVSIFVVLLVLIGAAEIVMLCMRRRAERVKKQYIRNLQTMLLKQ